MQMANNNAIKQATCVIDIRCTNASEIANKLLATVHNFSIAFAFKDRDYSVQPTTNNDGLEFAGINGAYYGAVRFKDNSYMSINIAGSYDAIAEIGDKYIIWYKD